MPRSPKERADRLLLQAATSDLSDEAGQSTIFNYYKSKGYLPAKDAQGHSFKSMQDFLNTVQKRFDTFKTQYPDESPTNILKRVEASLAYNRQLRSAKTGVGVASVVESQQADPTKKFARDRAYEGLPLTVNESGKVGINKRQYMSAEGGLPRPVFDFIANNYGEEAAVQYQKAVQKEWRDMGDVGRELSKKTGVPFHRGHWLSNKYGGAESARAGSLEIGPLNELHGAAARGDIQAVAETGRGSLGWLNDYYEWDLTNNELNVQGSEHLKQADLQAISNGADANQLIAQRTAEFNARGQTPDTDSIGQIFGSQLGVDETLKSQQARLLEEQALQMKETGFDPRYGREATPERMAQVESERKGLGIQEPPPLRQTPQVLPSGETPKGSQFGELGLGSPPPEVAQQRGLPPGEIVSVRSPDGNIRIQARNLALFGLGAVGWAGTAASAAETGMRTKLAMETKDPLDIAQAGLSGLSTAGDVLGPVGEIVSTPADVLNVAIDRRREMGNKSTAGRVMEAIIPQPKSITANTPTGVAELKRPRNRTAENITRRMKAKRNRSGVSDLNINPE